MIFTFCVCAAIVVFAITTNITAPWFAGGYSSTQPAAETRTGTESTTADIMVQKRNEECEIMKFDNNTGRTTDGSGHCRSIITLDAHGAPVPTGTIERLKSINKSFSGTAN